MPCNLTEHIDNNELDLNVVLFAQLQLLLLFSGNEKTEYIKGFEKCVELVEQVLLKNDKAINEKG